MNFTAIDFETATPSRHSICQIGICRVENGSIIHTESILVKPPDNDFSHWNVAVHRISPDLTENKPLFPEIWENIKPHIQKQLIIAHNIAFDLDCLFKTLEYYGLDFPDIEHDCTYKISGLNLIDLAEALEVEILNHHDAMNDAIMCANALLN
ncbi:MAG: 3'-5' exoribonuclease [Saprospiraceae bacterium]|nr:3'-5' exoribonuclease [Saprospiraceae bacterium]